MVPELRRDDAQRKGRVLPKMWRGSSSVRPTSDTGTERLEINSRVGALRNLAHRDPASTLVRVVHGVHYDRGAEWRRPQLSLSGVTSCARCGSEPSSEEARFCSKCGDALPTKQTISVVRLAIFPLIVIGRVLAYPMRRRRERIRWLTEASGTDSPVNHVPGLSDDAKSVYIYLADVTLRFGSSHSRIRTIAHVAGLSEHKTRAAIRELERHGLLSHETRNTWHGRGAYSYKVLRVQQDRQRAR